MRELAGDDLARAVVEIAELPYLMSRPFATAPGVPQARVEALRKAFMAAHQDPLLLAEAERMKLGITPVEGAELARLVSRLAASPPDVLAHIRKLQAEGGG